MFQALNQFDTSLLLYLNGLHSPFFDHVMWLASDKFIWAPLYCWFLWLLYRKYPGRFWLILVSVALMILVGDQLSRLFKDMVGRYRPTHEPAIQQLVHTVNGYTGGAYSFFSGHATNSFAVALFMIMMLPDKRRLMLPLTLAYAVLVSYSRIYLGVHYPIDILTGAIVGSCIGWGASKAYRYTDLRLSRK